MSYARAALAALLLWACNAERSARADCPGRSDCRPEMKLQTFAGPFVAEEAFAGKVVLVNFWATWCQPCERELPALQAVYARHRNDGFTIVGLLSGDRASDSAVQTFAEARQLTFPLARANADLERQFGMGDQLPTSYLYDRRGRLVKRWSGGVTEAELEALVVQTLR